ncbi:MAG: D-amino-acid transaminase [Kiloniellales bacterium]
MSHQAYVNGRYVPHAEAAVHIEDRGYQFADGVYEVVTIHKGRLIDEEPHLDRLERSLDELEIPMPTSRAALKLIAREIVRRNRLTNGIVYMQVTRGVAPRDHKFPKAARPALVMTAKQMKPQNEKMLTEGVKVITIPDIRWQRCDIKSVSLLPNVLGKQAAAEAGTYEAWQIDGEGFVTEGTSSNAWIVTRDREVVTRDASNTILNGITRLTLLRLIRAEGYRLSERRFSKAEAEEAKEAFLTSSSSFVLPVTEIDGRPVGNGSAGLLTAKLRQAYMDYMAGSGASS